MAGRVSRNLKVSIAMSKRQRGIMKKNKIQLKISTGAPPLPIIRTDTFGNPSESYHGKRMAAVRREWLHQFRRPRKSAPDLTLTEIKSIEARVRKELYP